MLGMFKKVRGDNVDFSAIQITSQKVRGNNVEFPTIEITSKKVRESNMDFSTSEITSKKLHGNEVNFWTIEITFKKYAEIRRNLVFDVSTWIRRGVPVGLKIRVRIILCNLYTFSSSSLTSVFNLGITWFNKRKIK